MGNLTFWAVFTMATIGSVHSSCPSVCSCPAAPPPCPPGVSSVPDGCGCCKVCAAQLNDDCDPSRPCDHHKGLECNYGNDAARARGLCRARLEGRSCEYGGRMFQNGESFSAGCAHLCTCVDGAVGCQPLCPAQLPLATPSCPAPRLVKAPGQCCPRVHCHKGAHKTPLASRDPRKPPKDHGNELLEEEKPPGKTSGYKHLAAWRRDGGQCVVQTTGWSPCSRSCGMGVSSRVSNDNGRCKLTKETRLCNIRPCSSLWPLPLQKGRKCSRTHKAPEPMRLTYAGCRSDRLYRPNYCGVCVDGLCCSPRRSRTVAVAFRCPDGERFRKAVMFVRSCKCGDECAPLNEAAMPPQRWLHGDTHKFAD